MRICGYAVVVTGNLRMLLRLNIRKVPCQTSAQYSCLINDVKSPFISLNVTVLATKKNLGQSYEKLRIRSDLGTSEENLTLNLRKTDQCSTRSFGSANYRIQRTQIRILPPALICFSAGAAHQVRSTKMKNSFCNSLTFKDGRKYLHKPKTKMYSFCSK